MLYDKLGEGWRAAAVEVGRKVKEEGKLYGAAVIGEWARNLNMHSTVVKGGHGFGRAWEEFRRELGWLIGLNQETNDRGGNGFEMGNGFGAMQVSSTPGMVGLWT